MGLQQLDPMELDTNPAAAASPSDPAEPPLPSLEPGWPPGKIDVDISDEARQRFVEGDAPVQVRVRATGLRRTQPCMIAEEVSRIEQATTVRDVLRELHRAKDRWAEMDIFKDISFDGFAPAKEGGGSMFVDLRFLEGDNLSLGVFTEANKVAPELRFNKGNVGGLGYSVFVDVQPSKQVGVVIPDDAFTVSPFRRYLAQAAPRLNEALDRGSGYFFSTMSLFKVGARSVRPAVGKWTEYCVSRTKDTHTRNTYSDEWVLDSSVQVGFGGAVKQTLSLSTQQRTLRNAATSASQNSELNSVTYDASYDARAYAAGGEYRHPVAGSAAWFSLQAAGRYAGLGTVGGGSSGGLSVDHVRADVKAQKIFPLVPGLLSLHLNSRVSSVFGGASSPLMNDRLYVETEYVRGWTKVGQQFDDGGLRGGDALAAASAQLCFPLPVPVLPPGILGGHLFLDAAGVGLKAESGVSGFADAVRRNLRASWGVGAHLTAVPILGTMGRMEFNLALPIATSSSPSASADFKRWKFGLQWAA